MLDIDESQITIIGHPFSSTGMGEQMRAGIAALRAVSCDPLIHDVYKYAQRSDPGFVEMIGSREIRAAEIGPIRIFHLNGDEIEPALKHMEAQGFRFDGGYNIVVPAWELPLYPDVWKGAICRFNEIWASSKFILQMFDGYPVPAFYTGQSVELEPEPWLPRRYFEIRESAFVLLSFYDTTSFATRKNPGAAIELLRRLLASRPTMDVQLILKVKSGDAEAKALEEADGVDGFHVRTITRVMSRYETRSLINACDCLVSLHRSEGFGRGCGEAMYLRKLALGTNWSGVIDFTDPSNSLAVPYTLVPVEAGAYPHSEGQVWAEPDVGAAVQLLQRANEDPEWADRTRAEGYLTVRSHLSHLAVGVRMLKRVAAAAEHIQNGAG